MTVEQVLICVCGVGMVGLWYCCQNLRRQLMVAEDKLKKLRAARGWDYEQYARALSERGILTEENVTKIDRQ